MKEILVVVSIVCLLISCTKQSAENSAILQNQLILGQWQSTETVRAFLTFDNESVKVVIYYDPDKPTVYNYKYEVVGESAIHINYFEVDNITNTRIERIEGTVSQNSLDLKCRYEKIDKLNLENKIYPVRTDESGLCAFHRFRRL